MSKSFEKRMDTEMRFHLEQLTEDYIRRGLTADEARRRALMDFGAMDLAKDEVRDLRSFERFRHFARDWRFAARLARRSLGFSTAAVATVALAIGAAVTVFGLVYAVVLRPLPYPDAERLVSIENRSARPDAKYEAVHMLQLEAWLEHASTFESLAAYNLFHEHGTFNLTGRGEPERLSGIQVSASLFPLLGARAEVGRLFAEGEDLPAAAPVVILGHSFWQRRFAADPSIVGEALIINDTPHVVSGVLAPRFAFSGTLVAAPEFDVFVPLVRSQETHRYGMYLGILGKLRPGVTREQAAEQIAALQKTAFGDSWLRHFSQEVRPLADRVRASMREPLWMLFGAVALLVFTGCANLANLFLARAAARNREVSVRAALGASRGRIVQQLLTECSLLAGLGTALGLALATLMLQWLRGAQWLEVPRRAEMQVHWPVAIFAVLACGLTILLFGLGPALRGSRVDVVAGLKEGGRGTGIGPGSRRLRWALVAVQVGLSFILLAGSGLLMRSLVKLLEVGPGFRPEQLVAMRVDPGERRGRGPRAAAFFDEILTRVRAAPGVTSAAAAVNLPLDRNMRWGYEIPGQTNTDGVQDVAAVRLVSPGYFYTLGIQMHAGRDFDSRDMAEAPRVVIVNRTLARQIATVREPIGSTLRISGRDHNVIAAVDDVKHEGLDRESGAEFYLAQSQTLPFPIVDIVVRSALPASAVAAEVRSAVWAIDPNQPVGSAYTLESRLNRSLSPRRFFTWMLGAFAVFAILLAFAGVYGVVSYGVTVRKREIGLRMALGATGGDIVRLFATESAAAAVLGLALGGVGAIAFVRLLGSQLYGIAPSDPIAFAAAGSIVAISVLIAALLPTRLAAALDPQRALGAE
jgi:predicted permease